MLSHAEIVSNQVRYNILQREVEEEVLPYCKKNGIAILAWAPIASGVLSGKYSENSPPADQRKTYAALFRTENLHEIDGVTRVLKVIADRRGKTIAQVALNWLISSPLGPIVPIPGAKNGAQAKENAGVASWNLFADELDSINKAAAQVKLNYFP